MQIHNPKGTNTKGTNTLSHTLALNATVLVFRAPHLHKKLRLLATALDTVGGSMRRVINMNCNGISRRPGRQQVEESLFANRLGFAIITESHLRKEEIELLRSDHYLVVSDYIY